MVSSNSTRPLRGALTNIRHLGRCVIPYHLAPQSSYPTYHLTWPYDTGLHGWPKAYVGSTLQAPTAELESKKKIHQPLLSPPIGRARQWLFLRPRVMYKVLTIHRFKHSIHLLKAHWANINIFVDHSPLPSPSLSMAGPSSLILLLHLQWSWALLYHPPYFRNARLCHSHPQSSAQ